MHYIPYRESKLTTILRQSLGGNSFCLMIANLSPIAQFKDENLSTLQYASQAAKISNKPKINQDPRSALISQQRVQINKLKSQLKAANDQIKFLAGGKMPKCPSCPQLKRRIKQLEALLSDQAEPVPADTTTTQSQPSHPSTVNNFNGNQIRIYNQNGNVAVASSPQGLLALEARESTAGRGQGARAPSSQLQPLTRQTGELKQQLAAELAAKQEYLKEKTSAMSKDMEALLSRTNFNMNKAILDEVGVRPEQRLTPTKTNGFNATHSSLHLSTAEGVNPGASERLVESISMIKDILLSNMQLREEQMKLAEDHDLTIQENYQLKIENEDLRDRLFLTTTDDKVREEVQIEYQAYLPLLDFQHLINTCGQIDDLNLAKGIILTYIYSLRKENRNLQRRLRDRVTPVPDADLLSGRTSSLMLEDAFAEFRQMEKRLKEQTSKNRFTNKDGSEGAAYSVHEDHETEPSPAAKRARKQRDYIRG